MEFGLSKYYIRNEKVNKRIKAALKWLDSKSIEELLKEPIGAKKIADGVELRFQSYETREYETMDYETHRKHIDIHYMIKGNEWVRWADSENAEPVGDYDPKIEIQFFKHPKHHGKALLTERHYAIFDPYDLHAAHGMVNGKKELNHKVCVKIDID